MKYFFILGNNPTLSVAEIQAVLGENEYQLINQQILIVDLKQEFKPQELIASLGGTIKIGIIKDVVHNNFSNILSAMKKIIKARDWDNFSGKFKFGFSVYNLELKTKILGMEIKKFIKEKNISCRWVVSKEKVLSSVVVEQNGLVKNGIEFVLFAVDSKIYLGQTLVVQPFKFLSARDYGRPERDDKSGMLPPKLAQIMINLASASKKEILLDPFCGSGTVLSEALLIGFDNVIGSDISPKAIQDTEKNLKWIIKKQQIKKTYQLYQVDARKISQQIKQRVGVIITEPYLGPQRGQINIKQVSRELSQLYSQVLVELRKITKENSKIVMVWPVWRKNKMLNPILGDWQIISPIIFSRIKQNKQELKLTERNTIIYGRPKQKVWREIVILQKK